MAIEEMKKQAEKEEAEIAEQAEILTSLLRNCWIEGIDLDPTTRLEHDPDSGHIYRVHRHTGERIEDVTFKGAGVYNIILRHLRCVEPVL